MALGALPQPADRTSIQKPNGTWKQSGKGLAPESSRELVGCRKPSMEADVYKQQLGWLVMESIGSRSSSRMRLIQKAHQVWTLLGKKQQLVPQWEEELAPLLGVGAGARDCHTVLVSTSRYRGLTSG